MFELPVEEGGLDVIFSFYAGFISQQCKKYLKPGGILVANNSHGDSSIAAVDEDYEFIAVLKRNGRRFSMSEEDLDSYFIKKNGTAIDLENVMKKMTEEGFTKTAFAYVFRLIRQ
ncbi:MAG TPA: hypothetical protein DCO79_10055 [Spirochaeta sp.]|nr:hypothetical protein [Spirochaeta sp.]